ncbi:hypothetical protein HMPREF9098_2357 [Kingella denitrificans ATCC 33394]|uniref:Uncharacterized protein n=1 Tax=Kingella denitrificans ATCC 33394 TaxID=888741 RepID=F0F2P9_9NEIS|nr:hypothetical protein HMPREF9098_2357 [Kingella denitrificans ATCC 33394]
MDFFHAKLCKDWFRLVNNLRDNSGFLRKMKVQAALGYSSRW